MRDLFACLVSLFMMLSFTGQSSAQQSQVTPAANGAAASPVPRLIKFSGTLLDRQGQPLKGPVGVTFSLYAQQSGDAPLWMETQNVELDAKGGYTVLLGANSATNLPEELFRNGEARWLGVQPEREPELPRVLMVSVPYALKAADAETLGGLPPSAFLSAAAQIGGLATTAPAAAQPGGTSVVSPQNTAASTVGGTGKANFIPLWTNSTTMGSSVLAQNGSAVQFLAIGTATEVKGLNSNALDLLASAFKSGGTASNQLFRWQAEPVGNNTTSPSGKLNLLFASGTGTPGETGLSISSKGVFTFAPGQTLPTISGNETVTGNLSASQLISTVTTGTAPLQVTSTTLVPNLNASQLGGLSAGAFARVGAPNTFIGTQTIFGDLALPNTTGSGGAGVITLGGSPFAHNFGVNNTFLGANAGNFSTTARFNTAVGSNALQNNTTGPANTASGFQALQMNTTACCNTAIGFNALQNNTTGGFNTASGMQALQSNTTGGFNTAVGSAALLSNSTGSDNTAIGFTALESNTFGELNTASGSGALSSNTYGGANTATGFRALYTNNTGGLNTATGSQALLINTTGIENTASGESALRSNTSGSDNTGIGMGALTFNTTGSNNTAIGAKAGVSTGNLSNATAIGYDAQVNASNKIRLGDSSVTVIEAQVGLTVVSDRHQKENFQPVEGEEVLKKIRGLTLTSWNLLGQDSKQFRHYGPMAQDFFAAFGHDAIGTIGTSTTITSTDMDGIMMIATQALEHRTAEQSTKMAALKAELNKIQTQDRQIQEQSAQIAELQAQIQHRQVAQRKQAAQIRELQAQARKHKQVLREEESEINTLQSQITEQQKQMAARNQERADERSELAQLRAEVERLAAMVRTNNGTTLQASVSAAHR